MAATELHPLSTIGKMRELCVIFNSVYGFYPQGEVQTNTMRLLPVERPHMPIYFSFRRIVTIKITEELQ